MKKTIFPKRRLKNFWCTTHLILKGEGDATMPAKPGDVVISEIAEPHGLRAKTNLRLLVTIAPPI
jgi:hypothetical protein